MAEVSSLTSYKPSGFYFRRALRASNDPDELRRVAMTLVLEAELLRQFIRDHGMIPPKCNVMSSEAEEKGWRPSA